MIAALQAEAKAAGRMGVESHPATRPAAAEAEAIDRLLRLAEVADIPVIVVHLTCREGCDVIMEPGEGARRYTRRPAPSICLWMTACTGLRAWRGQNMCARLL